MLIICLFVCLLVVDTSSHVALTYPPARKYDLDFLDSYRSPGDCGMEAGDEVTQFYINQQVNVSWHLGYPHGGGIKIQILRDGAEPEDLLTDWDTRNKFMQNILINLPSQPCDKCTLRLLRQATEWGGRYQFRSCSDISILSDQAQVTKQCGEHGELTDGLCKCRRGYTGDRCQHKTGCNSDDDCSGQGTCELLDNTLYEQKACFCQSGAFGSNCEKKNSWTDARSFTASRYEAVDVGGSNGKVYWRQEDHHVEIVAEFETESWVAVGWRPADSSKSCQRFPEDAPPPLGSDFHAMDCTDIVIGLSKNGRGMIGDFYTRDRSTPRIDSFWGGEDDIVDGDVWEEDGKTIMRFRKKNSANGQADHPFQGKLQMIWATGQPQDAFYKNDQLKYHGGQRGVFAIEAVETDSSSLHPAVIGVIIGGILLALLFIVQMMMKLVRA